MNLFTKHPNSIGETYFEHLFFALSAGIKLISGGLACIIHAIFPFVFETMGSHTAKKILVEITKRQQQNQQNQ